MVLAPRCWHQASKRKRKMMIELKNLSEEARATLKKAIPYYSKEDFYQDEKYLELYKDFLMQTRAMGVKVSFNDFNTAILRYKRWMPLVYKGEGLDEYFDIEKKGLQDCESREEYRAMIKGTVYKIKGAILRKEV